MEVYGTGGTATVGYGGISKPDLRYRAKDSEDWTVVDLADKPDRFIGEITHFLLCVRTGATPTITAEDGLAAARTVEAAYRSPGNARDRRAILTRNPTIAGNSPVLWRHLFRPPKAGSTT